ncbi:hypothetical protein MTO96_043024 [Rhipicephalus appendiculatus]
MLRHRPRVPLHFLLTLLASNGSAAALPSYKNWDVTYGIAGPSPRCIKPDPLDASFIGQGGTLEAMSTKNQLLFLEQVLLISAIFHAEASSTCPVTLPADAAGFKWIGGGAAELQELGRHVWIAGPSPRCIKPDPLDASFIGQGGTLEAMSTKNQLLFLEQVLLISAIFHAEASSTCPVTLPADAAGFKWIGGGAAELQELGRRGWITGPSPRCIKPDRLDASFIGQGGTLEAMSTKNQLLFLEQVS